MDGLWTNRVTGGRSARAPHFFTLVELIAALVVAAILGALFVPLLEQGLVHSADAANRLKDTFSLVSVVEMISEDYEARVAGGTNTLADLRGWIGSEGSDVSGRYGDYHVVTNRYITFDQDHHETAGQPTDTLKVTLRNSTGEQLTVLFPNPVRPATP